MIEKSRYITQMISDVMRALGHLRRQILNDWINTFFEFDTQSLPLFTQLRISWFYKIFEYYFSFQFSAWKSSFVIIQNIWFEWYMTYIYLCRPPRTKTGLFCFAKSFHSSFWKLFIKLPSISFLEPSLAKYLRWRSFVTVVNIATFYWA